MAAEAYYQTSRGRGSFRGRGGGGRGGGGGGCGGGKSSEGENENCFICRGSYQWRRDYPRKEEGCTWCGGKNHIKKTCYEKKNGVEEVEQEGQVVIEEMVDEVKKDKAVLKRRGGGARAY